VSRRGKDLAAVIPIDDLQLLERLMQEEMDHQDIEDTRAAREIRKPDSQVRKQVNKDILSPEENPRPHGVEKMRSRRSSIASSYRAVDQIRDEVLLILVVKAGNREDVYRREK
jgi:mRNA interferase RelE/StbE